jgi:predicted transcriptional regulator YdeE
MNVEIVERPEMKAVVVRIPRDGKRVREAWKEISALLDGHPAVADRENGFVFIPEWQWATEVTDLWVGLPVKRFENLPTQLEMITIPAKRFAMVKVKGDRLHVDAMYSGLFEWFTQSEYERDVQVGSFGYEMNSLHPVNPFEIPADVIDHFDFEIYAPIKEKRLKQNISPKFPNVIAAEIRKGQERRLVGLETFVDQKKENPSEVLPRFWNGVNKRTHEIADHVRPFNAIGMYMYEPPFGPNQDFRFMAGLEVERDSLAPLPTGMMERTIPADYFLVLTFRGKLKEIMQVWHFFHGFWYPQQSEYDAIDHYEFECYDDRFLGPDNENSLFEFYFPIRKRG